MHTLRRFADSFRRVAHARSGQAAGLTGLTLGVLAVSVLMATSPRLPMVWDEGDALDRADSVCDWFAGFQAADRLLRPLTAEGLRQGWPFTTTREGHPAFYGLVIALGRELAPSFLDPLTRYRFGPMLLFAVACGAAGAIVARSWGTLAAAAAVLGILLQPRLFAHAHFASFDGPLTACWLLTWAALPLNQRSLGRGTTASVRGTAIRLVLCGAALGLTMACKASGLLAAFPVMVALLLIFGRRAAVAIPIVVAAASAVFWAVNPPLWLHPVEGLGRFLYLNLNRAEQPGLNISTWFAGRMYNLDFPLPWYNTLLWTAIAVPFPIMCFFLIGLIFVLGSGSHRRFGVILGTFWMTLVLARAIPGTPPHDGIRQFLPSFAILGIIAGIGAVSAYRLLRLVIARRVRERLPRFASAIVRVNALRRGEPAAATPPRRPLFYRPISVAATFLQPCPACGILQLALALFYLSPIYSLVAYAPQWLSYYNCLIGGVGGASQAGFEATYYWDALDDEVMRWLRDHTSDGETVFLATYPRANLSRLRAWNRIDWEPAAHPEQAAWYVVQNRPSGWGEIDRRLFADGVASLEKRAGRLGAASPVLLKVFSRQEFGRLRQATAWP